MPPDFTMTSDSLPDLDKPAGPMTRSQLREYWRADSTQLMTSPWRFWFRFFHPLHYFHRLLRLTEFVVNQPGAAWRPYEWTLRLRLIRLSTRLGITVPLNKIGPGLSIAHYGSVVIGNVRVGRNLRVHSAVNIGEREGGNPVIGDDVYIGPGAKIFGQVTIGDRSQIGANAVVLRDVPPDSTAIGVPARIIPRG